jgi:hypothetical protein
MSVMPKVQENGGKVNAAIKFKERYFDGMTQLCTANMTRLSLRSFRLLLLSSLLSGCVASGLVPQRGNRAEKTFRVSGYVLDSVGRKPAPGVLVKSNNSGHQAHTDASGHFVLQLPHKRTNTRERLVVETLLFAGSTPVPVDTTQSVTLLLTRTAYRFAPDGCLQPTDSVHMSPVATPLLGIPGTQMAFLIRDTTVHQPRKLRAVTLRVGNNGFPREPFRVRIYRYNGSGQPPGEDLLTENIGWSLPQEGVYSVDYLPSEVMLPAEGYFIAVEYALDLRFTLNPIEPYVPIGPVLRPPCAFANTCTWVYATGKEWHRATASENCWPLYESAVHIEVEPAPSPAGKH